MTKAYVTGAAADRIRLGTSRRPVTAPYVRGSNRTSGKVPRVIATIPFPAPENKARTTAAATNRPLRRPAAKQTGRTSTPIRLSVSG